MDIFRWLQEKKQEPVEPTKPPTRTQNIVNLFNDWGNKPFAHNGLVGVGTIHHIQYRGCSEWDTGNVVIQDNNITILNVVDVVCSLPCTEIYDTSYSNQLDAYIEALEGAIKERDDTEQKRIEKAKAQRLFAETWFDKGGDAN